MEYTAIYSRSVTQPSSDHGAPIAAVQCQGARLSSNPLRTLIAHSMEQFVLFPECKLLYPQS